MLDKLKMATARGITMADHPELMADVYGDRSWFMVEQPLPYDILPPGTDRLTFTQWAVLVSRVANVLREGLGVEPGDRVAIVPGNGMELVALIMACARVGAVAVPMNYMLRGNEIRHIVEDSGARVLFTDPEVFAASIKDISLLPTVEKWVMVGISGDAPEGFLSLDILLSAVGESCEKAKIKGDDVVGIFYTSGTTGFPKGAMVTSDGLLESQRRAALVLPLSPKDFGILSLPLAHIFGFAIAVMGSCAGVSGYIMRHFDPHKVLALIDEYHASLFVGVPAMYAFLLACNPEDYDLSSLKLLGSSADAMPPEHIEKLRTLAEKPGLIRRRKPLFAEAYGMVELTGLAALKPAFRWLNWPAGCVGFPMYPVRARVADDEGNQIKRGETGELLVRGPGVTKGYWNNPEATALVLKDGWLRTGDMVKRDRWGRIFFVDRVKDVIKCGGYSVFSVEVEEEILEHPEVEEVAVVGIPHRTMGHVPVAIVCTKKGSAVSEEELVAWCGENIATYKAPRVVKIVPIKEMPYGVTLKIMKKDLRERYKDLFADK